MAVQSRKIIIIHVEEPRGHDTIFSHTTFNSETLTLTLAGLVTYILLISLMSLPPTSYIWVGGVWVQLLVGPGTRTRAILVLRECICNASVVSLVRSASDDTGSLGSPLRQVVY